MNKLYPSLILIFFIPVIYSQNILAQDMKCFSWKLIHQNNVCGGIANFYHIQFPQDPQLQERFPQLEGPFPQLRELLPQLQEPSPQSQEQSSQSPEQSPYLREHFPKSSNIEFKSYENKNLGVNFDIPANWIQQLTSSPNEEIVFTEPNGTAALTIKVANASGVTIFEAVSDFINGLKEGSSQTQNLYLNNIKIINFLSNNQESSKVITYTFGKDTTFPILKGVTFITLNNNKAYLANFVIDVQNFESYNPIMQRILGSLKILSDLSRDGD